jgi:tetratricopeptide (TPR) repeat protein
VRAQDGVTVEVSSGESQDPNALQTKDLLEQAVLSYERGDFEQARALFETVHARGPTARTLRSLALVAYRQGRLGDAVPLFEQSLASTEKPLTAAMRTDLEGLLRDARAELDAATPKTGQIPPPNQDREPAPLKPSETTRESGASTDDERSTANAQGRTRRLKRAGYATLALAGAFAAVGSVALGLGLRRLDQIEEACRANPDGTCTTHEADAREHAARLDVLSMVSIAGAALAGGSALASATCLGVYYRADHGRERVSAGISLQVRF